jgi:hypothetical protein
MKLVKRAPAVKWITLSVLLVFVSFGLGLNSQRAQANSTPPNRISPALRRQLRNAQMAARVTPGIKSKLAWGGTLDSLLQSRVGDGIMIGDRVAQAQSAMVNGDHISCMR